MSFSGTLIKLIDYRTSLQSRELLGIITASAYEAFDAGLTNWYWAIDADVVFDETRPDILHTVKAIPIVDAAHEVHRAAIGTKVRLRKNVRMLYEAYSTAAFANGQVTVTEVVITDVGVTINAATTYGTSYRALDYDELGDSAVNGGWVYGQLPYGTYGKFASDGITIIDVITP